MKSGKPTSAELNKALYSHVGNQNLEMQILKGVLDWLNTLPNCKVWRQNVGGMPYRKADGSTGIVKFGEPGMSDLTGMINGIRIEVEIKRPGSKPSQSQVAWITFIRAKGGISFWTDSVERCVEQLRDEFESRNWAWNDSWSL